MSVKVCAMTRRRFNMSGNAYLFISVYFISSEPIHDAPLLFHCGQLSIGRLIKRMARVSWQSNLTLTESYHIDLILQF